MKFNSACDPTRSSDCLRIYILMDLDETSEKECISPADGDENPRKLTHVCLFVIALGACERMALRILETNLTLFIHKRLEYSSSDASIYNATFTFLFYIVAFLCALLADSYLGRYRTIAYFSIIYTIGLSMLATASVLGIQWTWLFFLSLYLPVTIGAGGLQANIVTFGADQFDPDTESKALHSYFNYFYWSANIAAAVATSYLSDIALHGSPHIPRHFSFSSVFIIAAGVMTIGPSIFFAGRDRYELKVPKASVFPEFISIVWFSAKKSYRGKKSFVASQSIGFSEREINGLNNKFKMHGNCFECFHALDS